jgi:hypothetical protein
VGGVDQVGLALAVVGVVDADRLAALERVDGGLDAARRPRRVTAP